jgi:hypothetical protein
VVADRFGAQIVECWTLRRHACDLPRPAAKSAGYWGMEANFVSFLAHSRCRPPVTRSQFRAWARALRLPIAAYDNHAWLSRIPDVATQLIFGGSPGPRAR